MLISILLPLEIVFAFKEEIFTAPAFKNPVDTVKDDTLFIIPVPTVKDPVEILFVEIFTNRESPVVNKEFVETFLTMFKLPIVPSIPLMFTELTLSTIANKIFAVVTSDVLTANF